MSVAGASAVAPAMAEHPSRRQVVEEMHLRRWPEFDVPAEIVQIVKIVDDVERSAERVNVATMPRDNGHCATASGRHVEARVDNIRLLWERHTEASSYTIIVPGAVESAAYSPLLEWSERAPGMAIRAVRILIFEDEQQAEAALPSCAFVASDLVSCHVAGGARLWSDFRIHSDGYGRLLIAANRLRLGALARTIQRVQELGNYRNLALVGLPVARALWPRLEAVERGLQHFGETVLAPEKGDDALLISISDLSLELISIATASSYRMSATAAYARLVEDRLEELAVEPIAGFLSLADFTTRRFQPAVRTCASLTERIAAVSSRAGQFTELLRTRVERRIENQNAKLLASLERSAALQVRLQHLVEGLSVVAISYYAVGLTGYAAKGVESLFDGFSATLFVAAATLPILTGVGLGFRYLRRRLLRNHQRLGFQG